jgi:hypothetical protein
MAVESLRSGDDGSWDLVDYPMDRRIGSEEACCQILENVSTETMGARIGGMQERLEEQVLAQGTNLYDLRVDL